MSVTFFVREAREALDIDFEAVTDDEYRVPLYLMSDAWRSTELNVAQGSAPMIFDAAGFTVETIETGDRFSDCFAPVFINGNPEMVGTMTADEADLAAANLFMGAQYLRDPETIDEPGAAKIIMFGMSWERVQGYAEGMKRLANLAREFETVIEYY